MMRERGFSSWVISSVSLWPWASSNSLAPSAPVTETWVFPSWVLSSRRAVLAAVSFSKTTSAFWVSPLGVISMDLTFPQNEKKLVQC